MAKQQGTASEKYLLSALDRIAKNSIGYAVLYVKISKLKPKHRHPEFVKIFAKLFDSVVGTTKGSFFILSNGDFVILGRDITQETVDVAVKQLREGLSSDPIVHSGESSEFAVVYEFPERFSEFYEYIENVMRTSEQEDVHEYVPLKRAVEANEIENVIARLDDFDVAEIVKRQSVVRIKGGGKFSVMFQEFFVAVKDLSRKFDEQLDLVANRWLFLYLTQALDKKTLSAFFAANLSKWPSEISINLNLSSVFSREFVDFAKNFLKDGQKVIVEVQPMDVFNNLPLYFEAKEILRKGGHKLLIDALSPSSLKMLNLKNLDPDFIKIFWEPLMAYDQENAELKQMIADMGRENVILAKCETDNALKWGIKYGITAFQGPIMDDVEVAMIKNRCPNAKVCTSLACLKRRRLLLGALKDECQYPEILEDLL